MSEPSNPSGITRSDSRTAARRNAYRKVSTALGIISGALALVALPYSYFLFTPVLSVTAVVMILGGILVGIRHTKSGACLIILGAFLGGALGLPILLWALLAQAFGHWVSRLPLLPLGFVLPIASFVLALMSLSPSRGKHQLPQEA